MLSLEDKLLMPASTFLVWPQLWQYILHTCTLIFSAYSICFFRNQAHLQFIVLLMLSTYMTWYLFSNVRILLYSGKTGFWCVSYFTTLHPVSPRWNRMYGAHTLGKFSLHGAPISRTISLSLYLNLASATTLLFAFGVINDWNSRNGLH